MQAGKGYCLERKGACGLLAANMSQPAPSYSGVIATGANAYHFPHIAMLIASRTRLSETSGRVVLNP